MKPLERLATFILWPFLLAACFGFLLVAGFAFWICIPFFGEEPAVETITDGFGNEWMACCEKCGDTFERPGSARCVVCDL